MHGICSVCWVTGPQDIPYMRDVLRTGHLYRRAMTRSLCFVVLGCITGCTSVSIHSPEGTFERRTYVGLVSVEGTSHGKSSTQRVRQIDMTTVGLRIGAGVSVGYLHDNTLSIPTDCRLVVIVKSAAQLEHVAKILNSLTKEDLCTASSPPE